MESLGETMESLFCSSAGGQKAASYPGSYSLEYGGSTNFGYAYIAPLSSLKERMLKIGMTLIRFYGNFGNTVSHVETLYLNGTNSGIGRRQTEKRWISGPQI